MFGHYQYQGVHDAILRQYIAQLAESSRQVVRQYNAQMENIVQNLVQSGRGRDANEAVQIACRDHGPSMAQSLQDSLRSMGARDITVTCP